MYMDMDTKIIEQHQNFPTFKEFIAYLGLEYSPYNVRYISNVLKKNGIKHNFKSRFSVIYKASRDELQSIVDASSSIVDVLRKFNLRNCGGNSKTLRNRIIELNIDTSTMINNKRNISIERNQYSDYSDYISKVTSRKDIKKYILENKLIEYRCAECPNEGIHNGRPLTLQLDHIDGDNSNNELVNLRFLCPNCHSQTETYCGRKNKKIENLKCVKCGKEIRRKNKTGMCQACNVEQGTYSDVAKRRHSENNLVKRATKVELEELLKTTSLSAIGKTYNVSDNAVRKWCIKYGIALTANKFAKSSATSCV